MLNSVDKGKGEWKFIITNRVVRVILTEKGNFELRPEGGEGVKNACLRKKEAYSRNSEEARIWLTGSRSSKAACEAGEV